MDDQLCDFPKYNHMVFGKGKDQYRSRGQLGKEGILID